METLSSEARRARIVELEEELAELRRQELAEKCQAEQTIIDQCRALKQANQPMKAIKLYRDKMGVGLREAKDYVDNM